jgi:hypothetical protein
MFDILINILTGLAIIALIFTVGYWGTGYEWSWFILGLFAILIAFFSKK